MYKRQAHNEIILAGRRVAQNSGVVATQFARGRLSSTLMRRNSIEQFAAKTPIKNSSSGTWHRSADGRHVGDILSSFGGL